MLWSQKSCKNCSSPWHTTFMCPQKKHKPLKKKGSVQLKYESWRDEIAKPFLDENFGHICSVKDCGQTQGLEVDHILNRGTHPHLKMSLENVQYLCNYHHQLKTYHIKEK